MRHLWPDYLHSFGPFELYAYMLCSSNMTIAQPRSVARNLVWIGERFEEET